MARRCAEVRVIRGGDPATMLDAALGPSSSGFSSIMPAVHGARVVVVPVMSQPCPVSPRLVELLVDVLFDCGAVAVTLAAGLAQEDVDRGHRDVGAMAAAVGYLGRTPGGRGYDVIDLQDRVAPAPVGVESVLSAGAVSAIWVDASVRIVLARAVSDAVDGYAGCLAALAAVAGDLPGADPADVVVDVLEHLPPTLAIIDAIISSHGPDGRHVLRPLQTDALLVGDDAFEVDCRLADLLGEDRAASRLVRAAMHRRAGAPRECAVDGDLTPFDSWVRPHPLMRHAVRRAGANDQVRRLLAAASGGPDAGTDVADPLLAGLRAMLTPLVTASDEPAARALLVGLLGSVAAIGDQVHGWQVTMAKSRVPRVVVPLGFTHSDWPDEAYDGLPEFLAPLDDVLAAGRAAGPDSTGDGLRWRYLDGAVAFETSRVIEAPFDLFVARVDVAQGISMMTDYLGGRRVVLHEAESAPGATRTRQAERNVYLPQPNYLAHWGGEPIDVCKIELVERMPGRHTLYWRTVFSPNGSAVHDDGTLTFADDGKGRTRLSVRGRQQFTLPPFWQAIDLDQVPEIKDELVLEAYRRFFSVTFDNLEACFEGREFRIGVDAAAPDQPLATRTLQLIWELATTWLGERLSVPPPPAAPVLDVHGFRHFSGAAGSNAATR